MQKEQAKLRDMEIGLTDECNNQQTFKKDLEQKMKFAILELQKYEQKIKSLEAEIEPNVKMASQISDKIAHCEM